MSFLYMEDGKVFPTEEGKELPAVKALYNADKTEGKRFYNDALIYIFFVYKKDGVYHDMYETMRKKTVLQRHLPKREEKHFEENKRVAELIDEYLQRQFTKTERLLYKLEKDIDALLERISSIPYTKTVKAKIPYTNENGDITQVPAEIELDNSEEKDKSMRLAEKLVDYGDKLRTKILKEQIEKRKSSGQRLFDKKQIS